MMIEPRNDRVLIRRIDKPQGKIILTDPDKGIEGVVLAVGPGKWVEGTWWHFHKPHSHWEWIPGHRQEMKVKIGQRVYFNSKWNDMGENYQQPSILQWDDETLHLVQESDIFGVKNGNL